MSKYIGFVYIWTNKINNKKYIGCHLGDVDDGYVGSGKHFQNAIKKYGIENFERKILYYEHEDYQNLILKEYELIEEYNAVENSEYYNSINKPPKYHNFLPGDVKYTNDYTCKNYVWCNDGSDEKRFPENEIPENWKKGRISISSGSRNYVWCNKKGINRLFHKEKIPEDWCIGRLMDVAGEKNSFFGKKHTKESKEKMSRNANIMTGEDNPASVKIIIGNRTFASITEASKFYNIDYDIFYRTFQRCRKYHETELYKKCLIESLETIREEKNISPFQLANKLFKERSKNENCIKKTS